MGKSDSEEKSIAVRRSKRQKVDKTGRLSALEKLKQLKHNKNKYEEDKLDNVFDELDEAEYQKLVLKRQVDNWIVDDGNDSSYLEDGREIFDDDLDDESICKLATPEYSKKSKKRKRKFNNKESDSNVISMFSNMINKKKVEEKISDDDILGDLMSELKKNIETADNKDNTHLNRFQYNTTTKLGNGQLSTTLDKEAITNHKIISHDLDNFLDEPLDSTLSQATRKGLQVKKKLKQIEEFKLSDKSNQHNSSSNVKADISNTKLKNEKNLEIEDSIMDSNMLNQYIDNISDIDFENMKIDTTPKQNLEKFYIEKDQNVELCNETLDKIWKEEFNVASENILQFALKKSERLEIPTILNSVGEKIFRFFWLDAFEDPYKYPGQIFLFGKIYITSFNEYVSCCINIKNIPRRIYLLPREYIKNNSSEEEKENNTMMNVYNDFNVYAQSNGIQEFRCIEVTKNYAFERDNVPQTADYLEIRYPRTYSEIEANFSSNAIETIFGTSTNTLELFLIERNIKGPCWLDIKAPLAVDSPFSWCNVQVNCTKMENISITMDQSNSLTLPPIVLATINVRVCLDSKHQKNEIISIGILLHHKFEMDKSPPKPPFNQHFCLITHPRNSHWPLKSRDRLAKIKQTKVICCDTEVDLLEQFLNIIHLADPDIIIGYDCGFQFEVLINKIFAYKIKNWSIVGKLKRITSAFYKGKINFSQTFCGRPICDIMKSAKELNLKLKSYDLASLCASILNKKDYKEIKPENCLIFYSSTEKLENLIQFTMIETSYILDVIVELNILPLALQITTIAGNTLSRTLSGGRSERNEFLLLHAFHNKGFILPDKRMTGKKLEPNNSTVITKGRKKPAYTGGLVLEPKKGFYDKLILLMDFNSLYPSIIQEFNLCFTTVPGAAYADVEHLSLPDSTIEDGIIPTEIRKLVESRVQVKKLLKTQNLSNELKMQYNIRQLALKLTANSMYGCLGATHCRFYAKGLAALITMKGREILQNTKTLVEKFNYEVIYGDTDSIMINTNIFDYDQVFNIGKEIKKEVNQIYKKIELDIDGVFKYLLLLQKKKYAAVTISKLPNGQIQHVKEIKGLDIVRRDWCGLACDIGNQILDQLLCTQSNELRLNNIFDVLANISNKLREGKVPLSSLVITKQLSKNPNEYAKDTKLSHVLVAIRLNQSGSRKWKAGDTVPYIICEDNTDKMALERAYHIEEFKTNDNLKIDINYYLLNQIHPVIFRICDPIEGIDDILIAQHLGVIDFYKPKKTFMNQESEIPVCVQDNQGTNSFKFLCHNENCKTENEIRSVITESVEVPRPSLVMCTNSDCSLPPWKYIFAIQNKLQLDIRKFITNYYYTEVECENPICSKIVRKITMNTFNIFPKCYKCLDGNTHRIHNETEIYNQLSFYVKIFTFDSIHSKNPKLVFPRELPMVYHLLKEFVEKQIHYNAYSIVDLTKLFWSNIQENDMDFFKKIETLPTIEIENFTEDSDNENA